jgi:hypothetical protein
MTSKDKKRTGHIEAFKRRKAMKRDVRKSSSIDRSVNCVQLDHEENKKSKEKKKFFLRKVHWL